MKITTNGWTKESIVELLNTSDRAVVRAVVAIYKMQTEDEKSQGVTTHHNSVGFSSTDAEFLTGIAKSALEYDGLTTKQLEITRKKIKKYWKQLLNLAASSTVPHRNQYERLSNG